MLKLFAVALLFCLVSLTRGKIYFQEDFGSGWEDRWITSEAKEDLGVLASGCGPYGAEDCTGVYTSQDAKFYAASAPFSEEFDSTDKDFVLQYTVAFPQSIDCGGGYLKVLPPGLEPKKFEGESPYNWMFGPDICGSTNKKVHVIVNHDGENHLIGKTIYPESDRKTHLYALVVHPDNSFQVYVDGEEKHSGSFTDEDWSIFPPAEIDDPEDEMPEDWPEEYIDDPDDVKPDDWDSIPEEIPDEDAEKPDDWDEELDGEWERPMIRNPDYKGEWSPKRIKNPEYKGEWAPRRIPNPDYAPPTSLSAKKHAFVGIDLWQVKSGTVFSHIVVADNYDEVKDLVDIQTIQEGEEAKLEEEREAEAKKREEEAAAAAAAAEEAAGDDDDEEDDEDFEDESKDEL